MYLCNGVFTQNFHKHQNKLNLKHYSREEYLSIYIMLESKWTKKPQTENTNMLKTDKITV